MIKMIHSTTGVEMWVHESNVADFMKRGHKVAPAPVRERPATKKTPPKKTTKK